MKNNVLKLLLLFVVTLFTSCVEKEYITNNIEIPEPPKDASTYTIMPSCLMETL